MNFYFRLTELASQCGIELNVVDKSLQYLEKIVPAFEQPRMPSVKEMSELVQVESHSTDKETKQLKTESLLDYSHRNRTCKMKINVDILKQYDAIRHKPLELDETLDLEEDSGFNQILPDGRLNIFEDSDSENENIEPELVADESTWNNTSCLLKPEFFEKYNIKLYNHEIDCLLNGTKPLKEKHTPVRDKKTGKFVKATTTNGRSTKKRSEMEHEESGQSSEEDKNISKRRTRKKKSKDASQNIVENNLMENSVDYFDLADSDISILEDDTDVNENMRDNSINDSETLFRPYRNYWMYHCIFSRVKPKNFELFEKELPENFLWLLNECASIVEMTTEDLYEEVCLIEALHFNILKSNKSKDDLDYEFHECKSKSYSNNILNKW